MTDWRQKFEQMEEQDPDIGFEELVRTIISEETGYACEKRNVLGRSGNHYEVDAVPMVKGRQNDRFLHLINIKDTKVAETNKSTWYNHVDRAHARMDEVGGDFVPKSLVLREFSDVGDRSFRAEFASIGARIIDIESFGTLIEEIELFKEDPSLFTNRPRVEASTE
jgi:hypothetical protein